MPNTIAPSDYLTLLLNKTPIIDLRAPVEYRKGTLPGGISLPLMNDSERGKVGHCYKHKGQQAAVELGHQLVSGDIKAERINAWMAQIEKQPETVLCCFRGGMRSQISQAWLKEAGSNRPYIQGGYKAVRQYLIGETERVASQSDLIILSGMTGSGKTDFLNERSDSVDLEGIANHRGSSFGRMLTEQPSQIDFENQLALALIRHNQQQNTLLLEDESRLIGRESLPLELYNLMMLAPRVVLVRSTAERVEQTLKDYVVTKFQAYRERDGEEQGWQAFSDYLLSSLERVQKRLGQQRYDKLKQQMLAALAAQQSRNDLDQHRVWIEAMLLDYYDPMYHYQRSKLEAPILYQGSWQEVHQFLNGLSTN
ncbi:tRNA 2-selenouridine(34) synthase MnmH [Ferrimonas lipolytica]|uniref:tRNA 2-selenouridine synthase n=1 Tax=Ferrimonas lipolytica TaxID=2724191 RepID=A0A6H1UKV7_9GAMM|nr:tRNA 2-selenouridine(34) synthase MnmH [Ferrimonas lipolytica]QIZ78953.1 tRNA 2-selenouridine(34) synthase MnmH [Ferrimonas lipolytica]